MDGETIAEVGDALDGDADPVAGWDAAGGRPI
jgi:hypothetical protein